jgi:hypothetical protein
LLPLGKEKMNKESVSSIDFDVSIRYDANVLPDGVAVREQAFRETAAHDRNKPMLLVICLTKVPAANQRNSECSEKTRRDPR